MSIFMTHYVPEWFKIGLHVLRFLTGLPLFTILQRKDRKAFAEPYVSILIFVAKRFLLSYLS
jgi:hypothetical protein